MPIDDIDVAQEFSNADVNLLILLQELEKELRLMQIDLTEIKSPIIRGMAQKEYLRLKEKYFYLLAKDLQLLKLYETDNDESESEFTPM